MVTGIVEEIGTVESFNSGKICIKAKKVLEQTKIGDSICVNGVCLTVTKLNQNSFYTDVMNETLNRSNLGLLLPGCKVNLERAMSAQGRFGGHIVSGHIDGTGTISKKINDDNAIWVYISTSKKILKYIIEKGSICIDGISLTVAKVSQNDFAVSVIPHTSEQTTLISKKVGESVNLENDIIGKYVEKLLNFKSDFSESDESQKLKDQKILSWLTEA